MEMLIIGSGCLLGYMLNKDGGKQGRTVTAKDVPLSANRLPNGTLIYDSNRVEEVKQYEQNLAAGKYDEKMKQLYPETYAQPLSVHPDDSFAGTGYPAPIAALGDVDTGKAQYDLSLQQAMATNANTGAFDPASGLALFPSTADTIDSSPMFRAFEFKGPMVNNELPQVSGPISLLSGQPLDMTHHNMQPMFGSMVKQTGVENANSQVLLERFTGMPSTDDQGTYRPRQEVLNPLPNNPDPLARANISQADIYSRAQSTMKSSHEYVNPVASFRDLPLQSDSIRILPYDIDQTRGGQHKQITYEGVMIPGQKGSTRGMLPNMRENRWDLLQETQFTDLNPNRAATSGKNWSITPNVRNVLATTQDPETNYFTAPNHQRKVGDYSSLLQSHHATADETVSRRLEPFSPGFGTARGTGAGRNVGTMMLRETEKGLQKKYTGQPFKNVGSRQANVTAPEYTLKDASSVNTVGPVNASGTKDNTAYRKQNVDAPVTTKDMNSRNRYRGQPHKNLGMGFKKQGIEKWTTNKEINQFSKTGNPKNFVAAHMSYDAIFEPDMDRTIEGDRYGVGTKGMTLAKKTGEVNDKAGASLIVEDYVGNPSAHIAQGRDRNAFADGLTEDVGGSRLEFGGHMNSGKLAVAAPGSRESAMRVHEDRSVQGRMNVPLRRDNPNGDGLSIEAQLKEDCGSTQERRMVQRTQPLAVVTDRMPVSIKTRNVEALNPRLDTGIKITSDLYPWIKDKGTPA